MAMVILCSLLVLIGATLGWVSFFQVRSLKEQVRQLRTKLDSYSASNAASTISNVEEPAQHPKYMDGFQKHSIQDKAPAIKPSSRPTKTPRQPNKLITALKEHWMILLGGICIGLSGIFMVKYSIDAGLLSPAARIGLAIITGLALHITADWLRRKTGAPHPAFAALAGGASITLYAAFLAALHLYQLMSPNVVFGLLAIISLGTMALALLHGPVLAIIGILGGYVVPILLFDDSSNIVGALLYSLIISASALVLMRYIYRSWLWLGVLAGAFGWWWISTTTHDADSWRGLYLAMLIYLLVAIPQRDYLLQGKKPVAWQNSPLLYLFNKPVSYLQTAIVMLLVAAFWSVLIQPFDQLSLLQWAPLTVLVLVVGATLPSMKYLPWLYLLTQLSSWFASQLNWAINQGVSLELFPDQLQPYFLIFAGFMSLFYCLLGANNLRNKVNTHLWSSLVFLTPLLWFALCYLVVSDLTTSLKWSGLSIILGLGYLAFAAKRLKNSPQDIAAIWLIFAGHTGYSLAAAMFFREAGLTLALAAQLVSLAFLITHFRLDNINWLLKLIIAVVIARLSLNPWLLSYTSDVHWSLWTYGGSTALTGYACYLLRHNHTLRQWLEAATLHLLVLTLGAEVRYWLYDGAIFSPQYTLTEAAINTSLWAGLSLCYVYRAQFAENLQRLYLLLSNILLTLAAINYAAVLIPLNPLFSDHVVNDQPLINLLLLAYGAPVVLCYLVARYHLPKYRLAAGCTLGIGLFAFVSLEIRHLWQGALNLSNTASNGELYTYSVVWMLLAVAAILLAYFRKQQLIYRAGIGLLAVVIAKIFLMDMSDLEGLLRVASFMGLGLVLLGLAYLHRLLGFGAEKSSLNTSD